MAKSNAPVNGSLASLESTLETYFVDKAPFQLPDDVKEAIVKFGPWILLVLMILALPALLAVLGLGAIVAPLSMVAGKPGLGFVSVIISLAAMFLNLMALPGLFNRTMQGWRYAFYAQLLSIVASIVSFDLLGAVLTAVIGFYILFQLKSKYK